MKCQTFFPGKNKKNIINLSSAELAKILFKSKMHDLYLLDLWYLYLCLLSDENRVIEVTEIL